MTDPKHNTDHALLARLNALKKSTIDLDAKKPAFESSTSNVSVDPAPARALHADLTSRFKFLNGQPHVPRASIGSASTGAFDLLADEDGKTVEDLLAELGPEDSWKIEDEEGQIKSLLKTAQKDLQNSRTITENNPAELDHDSAQNQNAATTARSNDRKANGRHSSGLGEPSEEEELDQEADEYIAQVLEELRLQPDIHSSETHESPSRSPQPEPEPESHQSANLSKSLDMPSAPDKDLEPPPSYSETTADDDLASRFASLGMPSVPKTIQTPAKKSTQTAKQPPKGFTDEEIDSWCIICNEDATLRCIGCDDDLYCTNCWLDGHKGPDAGYEERKHKAVQYNKGGGMKKQPARRTLIGA